MKKSKRAWKRVISFLGIMAVLAFLSFLLLIHIIFPVKYNNVIMLVSKKYGIDSDLIRAVIWVESKYDKDVFSDKGAVGLMQLLPDTARYIAPQAGYKNFNAEMLYNETVNIELGVCYLRYLFDKFDDEKVVLAAYNAGEGNVREWQKKGLEEIPFKETREYAERVIIVKKIYNFKYK